MTRGDVAEAALTFVSGWEFFALATGLIPPWTRIIRPLPRPVKAVIVGGAVTWFVPHLMKEG